MPNLTMRNLRSKDRIELLLSFGGFFVFAFLRKDLRKYAFAEREETRCITQMFYQIKDTDCSLRGFVRENIELFIVLVILSVMETNRFTA